MGKPKFLFLLLGMMLLLSFASAFEFDNTGVYNEQTKEITIYNCDFWAITCLNLGEEIGRAKLNTPLDYHVGAGYQKVAEFDLSANQDYNDIIKNIDFYNRNYDNWNSHRMYRDFDIRYKTYRNITVEDYETTCTPIPGAEYEIITQNCTRNLIGTHEEEEEYWEKVTPAVLKKNEQVTVGIFTEVEVGDKVEWIPSIYGVEVDEWASWTADLNTELIIYWNLDESSGAVIDSVNNFNGTNNGATAGVTGIIGTGYEFNNSNTDYITSDNNGAGYSNFTVSVWVNALNWKTGSQPNYIYSYGYNNIGGLLIFCQDNALQSYFSTTGNIRNHGACPNAGDWAHLVLRKKGGNVTMFINGTQLAEFPEDRTLGAWKTELGWAVVRNLAGSGFNGSMDEFGFWNRPLTDAEITQLYNGGLGITYSLDLAPTVTLNSPSNNTNFSTNSVTFNVNVTDDYLVQNVSLYIDGVINQTNSSQANGTYTFTKTMNDGSYNWSILAYDNNSVSTSSGTYYFIVDTTAPSVTIDYPTASVGSLTNGENVSLNTTIVESNPDTCWLSYNGSNVTIPSCADYNFTYVQDVNTITVYANDTVGNLGSDTVSWTIDLQVNSQTYDATAVELSESTFVANITYDSSNFNIATGTLSYNGTSYVGTKAGTGDTVTFTRTITTPDVSASTNYTFYWNIALTNASGTYYYNLTSYNQTVSPINMSLCTNPYNVSFINFTVYDEETLNALNATFETTFAYSGVGSPSSNSFSYTEGTSTTNEFDFCFDPSGDTYEADITVQVGATGYVTKYYNWESLLLTNTTTEQSLYLLNDSDSTSFIIQVIDIGASPQVGFEVEVQRYSVGSGSWLTTEILTTNYEGKAIAHLYSEDVDYRFLVSDAGVSVYNSTSTKIACEATPCTVTLVIPSDVDSGLEGLDDLTTSLTYNENTNVFTFTYQDDSSAFSLGNLTVRKWNTGNASDNAVVCSTTSAVSSAVLQCDISSEVNGTYIARGYIVRTDSGTNLVETLYGFIGDTIYNRIGNEGVLWGFFVFISIVMLGVFRPSLGILAGIGGVIALNVLNLMAIGWTAMIAIVAIGVILLVQSKNQ